MNYLKLIIFLTLCNVQIINAQVASTEVFPDTLGLGLTVSIINTSEDSVVLVCQDTMETSLHKYSYDEVLLQNDSVYRRVIIDSILFTTFWDTIPQPNFWQKIMNLPGDSAYMNIASSRIILDKIKASDYNKLTDDQKNDYRDSLRKKNGLSAETRILFSTGKQFFYKFENAIPNIDGSIPIFIANGVNPWYAQSILLIESPNKLQKSKVGANGPFQLMKYNAKRYGLTVNNTKDEREDLERSAYATARFLKEICIPAAKQEMDNYNICYEDNDLWFKLLVMHIYHAGGGNVNSVLTVIQPTEGGMGLIYKMWQTESAKFKNASQNYSQVMIAAHLELHKLVMSECSDYRKADMAFAATSEPKKIE